MPSIQNYRIPNLSTQGYLMPKLVHKFSLLFQMKPEVSSVVGTSDYLSQQVTNVNRPKISFDKVTVARYNSQIYIPGRYKWDGTLDFDFEDDIGGLASNIIQAQLNIQQQVIAATGGGSEFPSAAGANQYKFLSILTQYDGQNDVPIEQWQYEGCWIEKADWGKNDYKDGGVAVSCSINLSFDNAIQILNGNTADNVGTSGFSPSTIVV